MRRRFAMSVITALSVVVALLLVTAAVPAAAAPAPVAPPGDLSAAADGARSVRLSWSPVSGATGYRVYWGDDPAFVEELADTTATTYVHAFLAPGHSYLYGVATLTRKGVSARSPLVSVTTPPEGPTLLSAEAVQADQVRLSWQPGSGATSYRIEAQTSDGVLTPEVLESFDRGALVRVSAATSYVFRVRGVLGDLLSLDVGEVEVTTPPRDRSVINIVGPFPVLAGGGVSFDVDGATTLWPAQGALAVSIDDAVPVSAAVVDGTATLPVTLAPGTHTYVADYSGDGAFEPSTSNGTFPAAEALPTYRPAVVDADRQTLAAAIADVTCDGVADVATGASTFDPGSGTATGTVDVRPAARDGSLGEHRALTVTDGTYPLSLAAGDLDGDRCADLLVATGGGTLLTSRGSPSAPGALTAVRGVAPVGQVRLADLTADGRLDAVFPAAGGLTVLPGTGRGGFGKARVVAPLTNAFETADLDGDGRTDLFAAYGDAGEVEVRGLRQTASGPFALAWTRRLPTDGFAVLAPGDLDGDRASELVVGGSTLSVLDGRDGSAREVPDDLDGYHALATGDLDDDGDTDLVAEPGPFGGYLVGSVNSAGLLTYPQRVALDDNVSATNGLVVGDIGSDSRTDVLALDSSRLVRLTRADG